MPKDYTTYPKDLVVRWIEPDGGAPVLDIHGSGQSTDAEDGEFVAVYRLVQVQRVHRSIAFEVVEDVEET